MLDKPYRISYTGPMVKNTKDRAKEREGITILQLFEMLENPTRRRPPDGSSNLLAWEKERESQDQ